MRSRGSPTVAGLVRAPTRGEPTMFTTWQRQTWLVEFIIYIRAQLPNSFLTMIIVRILEDMQILAFQISNAIENGIILCGLCRGGLDDHLNPAWVFYPSDLNYFIEFELADRQSRVMNPRPRKVPDSVAYLQHQKTISAVSEDAQEPLYVRRVLAPGDSASVRLIQGERGWHGHPIAAIRSAWRALGALRGNSIPLEDRAQLLYLLDLYRTPLDEHVVPPANLPSLPSIPPSPSNDQDPDDDADKKGKGKGKQVQTRVTKRPAPQETQKTVAGKRGKRGLAGVRKGKSHPLRKSVVGPEVKNQEPTNIIHWLNEVEGRTPPTAPPTPERD